MNCQDLCDYTLAICTSNPERCYQCLGYVREYDDRWDEFLTLEDLTTEEITELLKIRSQFDRYLVEGKVLEG